MRFILVLFTALLSISCLAQSIKFSYPAIKEKGNKIIDFVPTGWKISKSVIVDFNGDKLIDQAIVIQKMKPIVIDSMNTNPKMLIIVFQQQDKTYRLNTVTRKIFGGPNWGVMDNQDGFSGIGLRKNELEITFFTGGSVQAKMNYYFSYRNKDWLLTDYFARYSFGPSGVKHITEINFLTGTEMNWEKSSKNTWSKETTSYNSILKVNGLLIKTYKLADIDAELFIDPFKG